MPGEGARDLAAAASRGDAQALGELIARELPRLQVWVRLQMGHLLAAREASGDIVQSACGEVVQDFSHRTFSSDGHFRRELFLAAGRKLIDHARYHGAEKRDLHREADMGSGGIDQTLLSAYQSVLTPSAVAVGRELAERIEKGFARLDASEREIILMAKVEGLNHAEIAQLLGKTEGATRTALYRALGRLSGLVGERVSED